MKQISADFHLIKSRQMAWVRTQRSELPSENRRLGHFAAMVSAHCIRPIRQTDPPQSSACLIET
jgi:hypothetical protein